MPELFSALSAALLASINLPNAYLVSASGATLSQFAVLGTSADHEASTRAKTAGGRQNR